MSDMARGQTRTPVKPASKSKKKSTRTPKGNSRPSANTTDSTPTEPTPHDQPEPILSLAIVPKDDLAGYDLETESSPGVLVSAVYHLLPAEDARLAMDILPLLFEGKTLGQAAKKIGVPLSRIQPLKQHTAFRRLVSIAAESRKDILEAELYDRIFNGDNDNLLMKALEQLDPTYRSGFTAPPLNAVKIDIRLDGETMRIVSVDNERKD